MKKISELKKGDVVYLYSSDSRIAGEERKVVSVGKKYITVDCNRDHARYEVETMTCVDWCGWNIFLGTEAEYREWCQRRDERNRQLNILHNHIEGLTLEEIKKVRDFIYSL